ncbi:50S ribosomal protein L2 [candidate division WWE3 bacterium]|nr:50S ribosomal protein L2 [candidate division WWE3 bacterium]
MATKRFKPTSAGRRHRVSLKNGHLSNKGPEKSLIVPLKKNAGRSRGTISVRGQGGGNKRMYRLVDFKRYDKVNISGVVASLEYDPNRSAHIALVVYDDGEKRYILAPKGLQINDAVMNGEGAKVRVGNALPLRDIPVGTEVHNLELNPGQGGKIVRSAGQVARVMAKEGALVHVKLPSGEIRLFNRECYATIGQLSNLEHARKKLGKAGASRHIGRRPKVRGTAMAAGDHPHGGGEGRTGAGRVARTVYGKLAHGVRTRKKNKISNKYIVKSRRKK